MPDDLRAPFQYMGGKSAVADEVWARLGNVGSYVEPFLGSAAVLLARPDAHRWWDSAETVNDSDGLLSNYWRSTQLDPDAMAHHADWPVSECDLHARHAWLVKSREDITRRLEGDPEWCDARAAGWWVWGICSWIGGGWCAGVGPWHVVDDPDLGNVLVKTGERGGVKRQRPHVMDGVGINRKLPHLGSAGRDINRTLPALDPGGRGAYRETGVGGDADTLAERWSDHLREVMRRLSNRLRRVRICCGDWSRVCGPTPTLKSGASDLCGVFLDPPYGNAERAARCYAHDDGAVAAEARAWARVHGRDPRFRIALCGYDTEHLMPGDWTVWRWKANGGYANSGNGRGRENAYRETIWFSPHCLKPQAVLPGCEEV